MISAQTAAASKVESGTGTAIARVAVFRNLAAARPAWEALSRHNALATPYQQFEFLSHWQQHVGAATGVSPFIVVGYDSADAPLFLWPLGCRKAGPFRIAEFLGGKHANFNLGLWRRDALETMTEAAMRATLSALASEGADTLVLFNQPQRWDGIANPFALLPYRPSPSFGYSGTLSRDFDALFTANTSSNARKKLRAKERNLAKHGTVRFERAADARNALAVLDAFFEQKSTRMLARGLGDVFAAPGVRDFITAAALDRLTTGSPVIELYSLSVDDAIIATTGGVSAGGRFTTMFNSMVFDRFTTESAGTQLLVGVVRACCERGLETFDLGVGEAQYKDMFCDQTEPLFDSILPLTAAGHFIAFAARSERIAKRVIKHSPALWSAVESVRRLRGRMNRG